MGQVFPSSFLGCFRNECPTSQGLKEHPTRDWRIIGLIETVRTRLKVDDSRVVPRGRTHLYDNLIGARPVEIAGIEGQDAGDFVHAFA